MVFSPPRRFMLPAGRIRASGEADARGAGRVFLEPMHFGPKREPVEKNKMLGREGLMEHVVHTG